MLGPKFDEALALACELHRDQSRKGVPTPYISHLMAVAGIVLQSSDAIVTREGEEKPPWEERKRSYLAKISGKSRETLLVSCADKLHNARSIMFDHDRIGDEIWERFSAGRDGTVWYYRRLAEEFARAWPDNPLLPEFEALVARMEMAAGL